MRKALRSDKDLVVNIIAQSFDTNPSVNSVVKNDRKRGKRIRHLAKYAFKTGYARNGVFISSDKKGVAICYRYNYKKETIKDYWNQLILVITSIGLVRVFKIMKRDSFVKNKRPSDGNYMYFWFLGVLDEGRGKGASVELKNYLFSEADKLKLPVYLETSVDKNIIPYKRYGFKIYYEWENEDGYNVRFMRRDPK